MIDNNRVVELLRQVIDPNTGQDLVTLKRIQNLKIDQNNISFDLLMNDNSGALKSQLYSNLEGLIKTAYPDAVLHIHFTSGEGSKNPLPHIKNVIAVASGKGGVGKSTVAANLALALKAKGARVGLIDADLYGPSVPTMFDLKEVKPEIKRIYGKNKMIPIEKYGIHLQSIGFIIQPEQAVVLRGPRLGGIIQQFIKEVIWPELDFLIIDLPPGTGDIQLTLVQTIPVTGAVMVTSPQGLAYDDALKAMNMFLLDNIKVPILGVVENMSWFTPAELPNNKYKIFGEGGGKKLAKAGNTVFLGQIPIIAEVGASNDSGIPVMMQEDHLARPHFERLADNVNQQLNLRNEVLGETQIVKVER